MKIAVLCPSRGRPKLAKAMEESFLDNSTSDVTVYFYLNTDDETRDDYKVMLRYNGPDMPIAFSTNYLYHQVRGQRNWDAFMFCGDDGILQTPDWQRSLEIRTCIHRDGIWAAGFYDGRAWDSYPHFAVSAGWAETLGFVVPPYYQHWFIDSTTQKMAEEIGRFHKMDNILVEHQTFKVGKRPVDDTDNRIRAGWRHRRDAQIAEMDRYWRADVDLLRGNLNAAQT